MAEELINFDLPSDKSSIIKVVGIGGGGSNAVNHMFELGIKDVDFVICNTDAQALMNSSVGVKVQLGSSLTEGRGAGNKPEIGREAAIENLEDVVEVLSHNTKMVFITAGMGGGTGTGAAPVIARAAKELGILTVAIVTIPFHNEGQRRINQALEGIGELEKHVDSLLVINNEKIREIYGDLKVSEAFSKADNVLAIAAKGIAEIITVHGYINVDFADVETVMSNSGVAIMGSASAEGENRAINAIKQALNSPLLNDNNIKGAKNILLNITSGSSEITMDEIGQITDFVQEASGEGADLIWGNGTDETLGDRLSVTVIATGFNSNSITELYVRRNRPQERIPLNEIRDVTTQRLIMDEPVKDLTFGVKENKDEKYILQDNPAKTVEFNLQMDLDHADKQQEVFEIKEVKTSSIAKPKDEELDFLGNSEKAEERLKIIKRTHQKVKEANYNAVDEKDTIDDLESEPAYIRKKIKINSNVKYSASSNVSKYSLFEDEEMGPRLRADNAYLHDNVD